MYFDSSALVKLLVREPEAQMTRDAWRIAARRVTATIALPEVASALGRALKGRRISAAYAAQAWASFGTVLRSSTLVVPIQTIAVQAAGYATLHSLRGFDAVHLACARSADRVIVTFDRELAAAARAEGLVVISA